MEIDQSSVLPVGDVHKDTEDFEEFEEVESIIDAHGEEEHTT
jgi:hypothetical protein